MEKGLEEIASGSNPTEWGDLDTARARIQELESVNSGLLFALVAWQDYDEGVLSGSYHKDLARDLTKKAIKRATSCR